MAFLAIRGPLAHLPHPSHLSLGVIIIWILIENGLVMLMKLTLFHLPHVVPLLIMNCAGKGHPLQCSLTLLQCTQRMAG